MVILDAKNLCELDDERIGDLSKADPTLQFHYMNHIPHTSTNYKQGLKAFGWTLFHRTTYILATLTPKLSKHPYTSNQVRKKSTSSKKLSLFYENNGAFWVANRQ
jgi:hypothetical protein